jgi:hypothetical protein
MALSRLENFIKNIEGNILYVNPNDLDSTDDITNQGNSLTRPFKTVQRALIESARFSYQIGLDNDKFDKTTIMLYPAVHAIDNRPGYKISSNGTITDVNDVSRSLTEFSGISNFDLTNIENELYKYNSINGGIIIPRGTSIVGMDLRKTKIIPKYVPDPLDDTIPSTAIFRITGACYFWQFTIFDGSGSTYKNYQPATFAPDYSHHKLTAFEYADGTNIVSGKGLTDLQMYFYKITKAYGNASGRSLPDFPAISDFQPRRQETEIVGSLGDTVGITSIFAGDSVTPSTSVTVITEASHNLGIDSPIRIAGVDNGVSPAGYDGLFIVSSIDSTTQFKYTSSIVPTPSLVAPAAANVNVEVDTVTGCSPYIFNISLRSVFGMNGMHADGAKATGFKSMVVAQFTGIGLQKDDNAFIKFNETTGLYDDQATLGNSSILHLDSRAIHKPQWKNTHIKTSNDSVIQNVSIFAIGFAQHFECNSGGDMSITNSNSNFGALSLASKGFKLDSFNRDNRGFITSIISPNSKPITDKIVVDTFKIDISKTISVGISSHLYLYGYDREENVPQSSFQNYKVGAKNDERVSALLSVSGIVTAYEAPVVMNVHSSSTNQPIARKEYFVKKSSSGINNINTTTYSIELTKNHDIETGEKIRIISENGSLPGGLKTQQIYYAIRVGSGATSFIKVAAGLNESINQIPINLNNKGGTLKIESNVSDKLSGQIGHPIQWDSTNNRWYLHSERNNGIFSVINTAAGLPTVSGDLFITRDVDSRRSNDKIYKLRLVIPKEETDAKPPLDSFVFQESSTTSDFVSSPLTSASQSKNNRFISSCLYDGSVVYVTSEKPHDLQVGSQIKINNVTSSVNVVGTSNSGFNGLFTVVGISSDLTFTYNIPYNPGTSMTNNTTSRSSSLPNFTIKKYKNNISLYSSDAIQDYISGVQDGIYHVTVIDCSNRPNVNYFNTEGNDFEQNVGDLIPTEDKDNPVDELDPAVSYAEIDLIGSVVTNDPKRSISREAINRFLVSSGRGEEISNVTATNITLPNATVGSAVSVTTVNGHNFGQIISAGIFTGGSNYVAGTYHGVRLTGPSSTRDATAVVTVGASGTITNVTITSGGSAYGVGHTCTIVDIPRSSSGNVGVVTDLVIANGIGTAFEISGIRNVSVVGIATTVSNFNGVHQVHDIVSATKFRYLTKTSVAATTTEVYNGYVAISGPSIAVTSLSYVSSVGIVTVGCGETHGLNIGNKIKIVGITSDKIFTSINVSILDEQFYDNYFVVNSISSNNQSFTVKVEKNVISINNFVGITSAFVLKSNYLTQEGISMSDDERVGGRMTSFPTGVTKKITSSVASGNTSINLNNTFGLLKGDFIQILDEIIRIIDSPNSSTVTVIRGQLGTSSANYAVGEIVRKINPIPIEIHRPSISRASGHTFEYLGFGPGNYSTGLPQRQDRVLNEREVILSQSLTSAGGVSVYTGMNDSGDFYIGNKRIISPTGEEVVVDTPFPSDTSDSGTSKLKIDTDDVIVAKRIRVGGGLDQSQISSFSGPVVFSKDVYSTSQLGIHAINLNIIGNTNQSRNITVGISTPIIDGKSGDMVLNANPTQGGFSGWVYTVENKWRRFGAISKNTNTMDIVADSLLLTGGNLVSFAGTFTNITVTGIATINQVKISSGIATLGFVSTFDLYVPGIATFHSYNPSSTGVEFTSGLVGIHTDLLLYPKTGTAHSTTVRINVGSEHPQTYSGGISGRGARIINYVTSVGVEMGSSGNTYGGGFAGIGSGNIRINFAYGNNFEIDANPGTVPDSNSLLNGTVDGLCGPTTFFNPRNVIAGQQGSIEIYVSSASTTTIGFGSSFYFPGGTPPSISAGSTTILGYYVFESENPGTSPGKILLSGIEDLRPI